jgi:hypothetical protein
MSAQLRTMPTVRGQGARWIVRGYYCVCDASAARITHAPRARLPSQAILQRGCSPQIPLSTEGRGSPRVRPEGRILLVVPADG